MTGSDNRTELAPRPEARNPEAADGGSPVGLPREMVIHVPPERLPDGHNY